MDPKTAISEKPQCPLSRDSKLTDHDMYEFTDLDHDVQEMRFLLLCPCPADRDKNAPENHVHAHIRTLPLSQHPRFIAVTNARGYHKLNLPICVDDKVIFIPAAVEAFLRNCRHTDNHTTLWIHALCLRYDNQEEQKRYWNRPFADSMYERAVQTVDMNHVVSHLRDQGVIQRLWDPSLGERVKTWDHMPDHQSDTMPSTYPIRLGKNPSADNPSDRFDYVPLDLVVDEIRVLVLVPSEDPGAPVVTHLAHIPIRSKVVYEAVSYQWGAEKDTAEIVVAGQNMLVRKNLAEALKAIRTPTEPPAIIWIDAICIDQNNVIEKNRQIVRMSEIYDNAVGVLCYTGPAAHDSGLALELLELFQEECMLLDGNGNWLLRDSRSVEDGEIEVIHPDYVPRCCGALYRFLTRSYFRRVWILQEIAVASMAGIGCGTDFGKRFEQLDTAAYNLQDMLRRDRTLTQQMLETTPDLNHVSIDELSYVRTIFYFRHLTMKGRHRSHGEARVKIGDSSPGFLETAVLARKFEATIPSDKIYALWNLAKDRDGFEFDMDYNKSTQEVYTSFAIAWSKHTGILDVIGAAESSSKSVQFYAGAPCWCPDWSVPSGASCLVRRDSLPRKLMFLQEALDGQVYAADGRMKQTPTSTNFFSFEEGTLHCVGIVIDSIAATCGSHDDTKEISDIETLLTNFSKWYHTIEQMYAHSDRNPYEDPRQAFWAMMCGEQIDAWRANDSDNIEGECCTFQHNPYIPVPELSQCTSPGSHSNYRISYYDSMRMLIRGRSCVLTAQGYLGLAPAAAPAAAHELLIAILATCSVPVLLEPLPDGTYRFHGTCFVQGWMHGEMMTDYFGADSATEFWGSLDGMERLRIV